MADVFNFLYNGSEPFVFLSYAIEDMDSITPIAELLNENNIRVWLDKNPKKEALPIYATTRIPDCGFLLAFVSPAFLASEGCIDSIKSAAENSKPVVAICPKGTSLPEYFPEDTTCFTPEKYQKTLSFKGISPCSKNGESTKTHGKNPDLLFQQAERHYFDKNDPQRYIKAFYYYLQGADLKHAECMYNLGLCFRDGKGAYKDEKKAFEWFLKAAEHGHAQSMFLVALRYKSGTGCSVDCKQAIYWYTKAAEADVSGAQYNLAYYYHDGDIVEQDYKKAAYWFEKCAERGDADAQNFMGVYYNHGAGVDKDVDKAIYWFTKAAEQGQLNAMFNLAEIYASNTSGRTNLENAAYWYIKSAEQGNPEAQYKIGKFYMNGTGVAKDDALAEFYLTLSLAQESKLDAQISLMTLKAKRERLGL